MGASTTFLVLTLLFNSVRVRLTPFSVSVRGIKQVRVTRAHSRNRAQELCESRDGRPDSPSLIINPYGLCGRKATLKNRAPELCESRGGRPALRRPVPNSPYVFMVSVDVKQH